MNAECDDKNKTSPGICRCRSGFTFHGETEVTKEADCAGKITYHPLSKLPNSVKSSCLYNIKYCINVTIYIILQQPAVLRHAA